MNKLFIFAAGAAVGSVITWKVLETKYKRIAQEEIDSVKERYSNKNTEDTEESEVEETKNEEESGGDPDMSIYKDILSRQSYSNEEKDEDDDLPFVIEPSEFGELDGYETDSLTYYSDGVLADDFDNVIEDVDNYVGVESLTHFGDHADDCVYVRNPRIEYDFEIMYDSRKFEDVAPDEFASMEEV